MLNIVKLYPTFWTPVITLPKPLFVKIVRVILINYFRVDVEVSQIGALTNHLCFDSIAVCGPRNCKLKTRLTDSQ